MNVGELYAILRLDDGQFNRGIDQAHGKMGKLGSVAGKVGGAIGTAVKRGAMVAGAAIAGLVGTTLVKGFNRLTAIENAEASLRGLGHSAEEVTLIMKNARDAVLGTAFGLDEAATVAANAVASGIKPGQQLDKTLRLIADSASVANVPFGEMGSIWGKVIASDKIQGDVIAQLNDLGISIVPLLAKELHKTNAETVALASAGKIHFKEFGAAMEAGMGGAALASGNTTIGAWKNMMTALSRLGADMLSGIFPSFKVAFNKIGAYFDEIGTKYGAVFKKWGEGVSAAFKTGGFRGMFEAMLPEGVGGDLISTFTTIKDVVVDIAVALGGISKDSLAIAGDVLSIVSQLTTPIGKAFVALPDSIKKFIVAAGLLAIALNK
ncbi:MAG TPA: tape measure protein, partial [Cryobacterium sp.]|nr:tape measure protein [Cryobacterium sp.]